MGFIYETSSLDLSGVVYNTKLRIYWAPFYDVIYHLHNLYDIISHNLSPLQILCDFFIDDMFLKGAI